jgi:hypothetical protein
MNADSCMDRETNLTDIMFPAIIYVLSVAVSSNISLSAAVAFKVLQIVVSFCGKGSLSFCLITKHILKKYEGGEV